MPHLSHSTCELWSKCPKAYQLQKIERAPQAPSEALILGDACHSAFEADESRLRGSAHGLADRLDGHRWPALQGEPQHDYEPPRTVPRGEVANRVRRLQALGNAVVVPLLHVLFASIVAADDAA